MKTPLEELAEAKRSGKFHPETEKNWPEQTAKEKAKEVMEDSKVLDPEQDRPTFKPEEVVLRVPYVDWSEYRAFVKEQFYWNVGLLLTVFSILVVLVLMNADKIDGKRPAPKTNASQPFKEAPPKIIKKIVKVPVVKKVIPREYRVARENLATARLRIARLMENNDEWRRKMCYAYGDWNACLAYKKDLPSRARVGRSDL